MYISHVTNKKCKIAGGATIGEATIGAALYFYNLQVCIKEGGGRIGLFLFSKISETPIVHVPKLFPLFYWFQNTFCFFSSSTPSHVGKFFRLQWEFRWENDQNE